MKFSDLVNISIESTIMMTPNTIRNIVIDKLSLFPLKSFTNDEFPSNSLTALTPSKALSSDTVISIVSHLLSAPYGILTKCCPYPRSFFSS